MRSLGSQQCCLSGESLRRDCRHDHATLPHGEAWSVILPKSQLVDILSWTSRKPYRKDTRKAKWHLFFSNVRNLGPMQRS